MRVRVHAHLSIVLLPLCLCGDEPGKVVALESAVDFSVIAYARSALAEVALVIAQLIFA